MYTATPAIETQSTDDVLPNQQDWLGLDRRGNWIEFDSQINTAATTQDRSLADPGGWRTPGPRLPRADTPVAAKAQHRPAVQTSMNPRRKAAGPSRAGG